MRIFYKSQAVRYIIITGGLFFTVVSCGSAPDTLPERAPPAVAIAAAPVPETAPQTAPPPEEPRPIPPYPLNILGRGRVPAEKLAAFLREKNPEVDETFAEELAALYVEEAAAEGVNADIAFSQMCHETGYLAFGGLVTADMNNFAGLGAIGPEQPGERFVTPQVGVRAQIQHLKAYATAAPLERALVDTRYRYVRYGSAPTIDGLAGTWAADRDYGKKLRATLERLYRMAFAD
jgi:hypothetical protein